MQNLAPNIIRTKLTETVLLDFTGSRGFLNLNLMVRAKLALAAKRNADIFFDDICSETKIETGINYFLGLKHAPDMRLVDLDSRFYTTHTLTDSTLGTVT